MGKILQIRLSANTYRSQDVLANWPRLCALAWPRTRDLSEQVQGVLQLIDALSDQKQFGDWSLELQERLVSTLQKAIDQKSALQAALADWNAQKANELSFKLEDTLDELEKAAPEID